jgi:EF hand
MRRDWAVSFSEWRQDARESQFASRLIWINVPSIVFASNRDLHLREGTAMNKLFSAVAAGAIVCMSSPSIARDDMDCGHGMMQMSKMDTDNDGTVSKEEFMKAHEAMWEKMKKNKDGLVDVKEMHMMQKGSRKDKKPQ